MTMKYNNPTGGTPSTVGTQFNTFYWIKKALIEAKKQQYFSQLADTTNMPKNMGKEIKVYQYIPLLDDANINDMGIDAAGASTTVEKTIKISLVKEGLYTTKYAVGEGSNSTQATTQAEAKAFLILSKELGIPGANYAAAKANAIVAPYNIIIVDSESAVPVAGNLYGSSKDVGYISGKLPSLTENGGRVNRVGFKRRELKGTFAKFGFFTEYTQESLDFDTDADLLQHVNREMILGANEITEDALQIDLLNAAGVVRYGGTATSNGTMTGEGTPSVISYASLKRLSIDLDNNRCPRDTKMVTGTRMIDTKVINNARFMYVGSELIPMLEQMTDYFGEPAWVAAEHYAAGTTLAEGEIGKVADFRVIVVPEMMYWARAGATVTANSGYRSSTDGVTEKYDVFPMLVVGSDAFTTIGFQTGGSSTKFKIFHKKPGEETADRTDPYGESGFMSIKWYYGILVTRPERIALCKTVAKW
jgi:N4-gp56 family major capsid protein